METERVEKRLLNLEAGLTRAQAAAVRAEVVAWLRERADAIRFSPANLDEVFFALHDLAAEVEAAGDSGPAPADLAITVHGSQTIRDGKSRYPAVLYLRLADEGDALDLMERLLLLVRTQRRDPDWSGVPLTFLGDFEVEEDEA